MKKVLIILVAFSFLTGIFACGGSSSNSESFCKAAVDKIFGLCDLEDPVDAAIILGVAQMFDPTVTAEDLEGLSTDDMKKECALDEGETDMTDAEKTAADAVLADVDTCEEVPAAAAVIGAF